MFQFIDSSVDRCVVVIKESKSSASNERTVKKSRSSVTGSGCPFNKHDPLVEFRDRLLVTNINSAYSSDFKGSNRRGNMVDDCLFIPH